MITLITPAIKYLADYADDLVKEWTIDVTSFINPMQNEFSLLVRNINDMMTTLFATLESELANIALTLNYEIDDEFYLTLPSGLSFRMLYYDELTESWIVDVHLQNPIDLTIGPQVLKFSFLFGTLQFIADSIAEIDFLAWLADFDFMKLFKGFKISEVPNAYWRVEGEYIANSVLNKNYTSSHFLVETASAAIIIGAVVVLTKLGWSGAASKFFQSMYTKGQVKLTEFTIKSKLDALEDDLAALDTKVDGVPQSSLDKFKEKWDEESDGFKAAIAKLIPNSQLNAIEDRVNEILERIGLRLILR